jgi:hypothetical protein
MANLRILEIDEIKTVPHVPLSHPFVERGSAAYSSSITARRRNRSAELSHRTAWLVS